MANKLYTNDFVIGESVAIITKDSFHPFKEGTIEYIKSNGQAAVKDVFSGGMFMYDLEGCWALDMQTQIGKWTDANRRIYKNQNKIKALSFKLSGLNPVTITNENLEELEVLLINIK